VNATIRAILQGKWLIDKQWAESMLPAVAAVLKGGQWVQQADGPVRNGQYGYERPFLVDVKTMNRYPMYVWNPNTGYGLNTSLNSMDGLVALVPISGPILKYDGDCGEAGSVTRTGWLQLLDSMPNVTGMVLVWDTPGGMVDGTNSLSGAIKALKKFSISYVDDGMCCSAGMWGATSAKEFYASKDTDCVGSIGVLCTLADFSGYYADMGIKVESIYAPQSSEKNIEYREWQKGNDTLIKDDLAVTASAFIDAIKANRPGAARHESKWATGRSFYAKEAKSIGLIDGIMPLSKVIQRAHYKGKNFTNMNTNPSSASTGAANAQREALLHAEGNEATVMAEGDIAPVAGFLISEAHLNAMGDMVAANEQAAAELVQLREQVTTLTAQLATANETIATHEGSNAQAAMQAADDATAQVAVLQEENTGLRERIAVLEAENEALGKESSSNSGTSLQASADESKKADMPSWYVPDGSEAKLERQNNRL
jgi:ClpP class serine protease